MIRLRKKQSFRRHVMQFNQHHLPRTKVCLLSHNIGFVSLYLFKIYEGRKLLQRMIARDEETKAQIAAIKKSKMDAMAEVQETLAENPAAGILIIFVHFDVFISILTFPYAKTGVIPDAVAKRMLMRMIPLALTPILGGVGMFAYFYTSATSGRAEFEPSLVAYSHCF